MNLSLSKSPRQGKRVSLDIGESRPRTLRRPPMPPPCAMRLTKSEPNYDKVLCELSESDEERDTIEDDLEVTSPTSPVSGERERQERRRPTPPRSMRHSDRRGGGGFNWSLPPGTGYSCQSFPRRGIRTLSSPALNRLETEFPFSSPSSGVHKHTSPPSLDTPKSPEKKLRIRVRTPGPPRSPLQPSPQRPKGIDMTGRRSLTKTPTVSALTLPTRFSSRSRPPPLDLFEIVKLAQPVVGVPVCPEIADPSRRPDTIEWWRKIVSSDGKVDWILVCRRWEYTPTASDVGCVLRVNLMVNEKPHIDFSAPVLPYPSTPSPRIWKTADFGQLTPRRESKYHQSHRNKLRLLTWNTLADAATRNGFGGRCPRWALQWPYRKDNLMKQIMAFDADIVCMQEIDKKYWNTHWKLSFKKLGFDGEYGGSTTYGCGLFFRTSSFRKIRHEVFSLDSAHTWAKENLAKGLRSKAETTQIESELRHLKCGRRALIFEFEKATGSETRQRFFVATVHLYKSDSRPHAYIRLLQILMVLKRLTKLCEGVTNPKVVIAGDFNSRPEGVIYQFMKSGFASKSHPELKNSILIPSDIRHPFRFESAYQAILGHEQRYCRKSKVRTPVVEYVWCSHLRPVGVVPISNDASETYALEKLSSDHHPLAVDLSLKNNP